MGSINLEGVKKLDFLTQRIAARYATNKRLSELMFPVPKRGRWKLEEFQRGGGEVYDYEYKTLWGAKIKRHLQDLLFDDGPFSRLVPDIQPGFIPPRLILVEAIRAYYFFSFDESFEGVCLSAGLSPARIFSEAKRRVRLVERLTGKRYYELLQYRYCLNSRSKRAMKTPKSEKYIIPMQEAILNEASARYRVELKTINLKTGRENERGVQ